MWLMINLHLMACCSRLIWFTIFYGMCSFLCSIICFTLFKIAPNIMFAYVVSSADIFSFVSANMFVKKATVVSATSFGFISLASCRPRGFPGGGIVYTLRSNSSSDYCFICGTCLFWAYWLLNVCRAGSYCRTIVGLPSMLWVGVLFPWITAGGCIWDLGFYW